MFCVWKGISLDFILLQTFDGFNSLHGSCMRLHASEKVNDSWLRMTAAQGTVENMEKNLSRFEALAEIGPRNDSAAAIRDLGSGF